MDLIRQQSIFDPSKIHGACAVVGVGALGSAVALMLAKLGLKDLVLFDHDIVEAHNICNQVLYGPMDVGTAKVHAAAATLQTLTGVQCNVQQAKVESRNQLLYYSVSQVFVCVDSMSARKEIFERCVYLNPYVEFFVEGRLSSRGGMTTAFDPRQLETSQEYMRRLYPDEDVVVDRGACGNILMMGTTAMQAACQMVWQFIQHTNAASYDAEISANYDQMIVTQRGGLTVASDEDDE